MSKSLEHQLNLIMYEKFDYRLCNDGLPFYTESPQSRKEFSKMENRRGQSAGTYKFMVRAVTPRWALGRGLRAKGQRTSSPCFESPAGGVDPIEAAPAGAGESRRRLTVVLDRPV